MAYNLRRVLGTLLGGMKSRVIVNGELGEWFNNESGVRQGDPLRQNIGDVVAALNEYDKATGAAVNLGKSVLIANIHHIRFHHPFRVAEGERYRVLADSRREAPA